MLYELISKMNISNWIQIILAFITSVGIWLSLRASTKQIKNANKQSLFDRRLELFMLAEEFKNLIEENEHILDKPTKFNNVNAYMFRMMTNNSRLNELGLLIPDVLDIYGPSANDNPELKKVFLIEKEKITQQSMAASLIFDKINEDNEAISAFIKDYVDLLDGRRRYDVALKGFLKAEEGYNERHDDDLSTEEYLKSQTEEDNYRQRLLTEPIARLNSSYEIYLKHRDSIKKQITL